MSEHELWVSCAPGLERLLAAEIATTLGLPVQDAETPGGVALRGDAELVARANLELGLATHVLVRAGHVRARGFDELVRKAARIEWGRWLDPAVPRTVLATSRRSRLYHTDAIAERITTAIDDAIGPATGAHEPVTIVARFVRDACTLSIDTSGEPLHRRGWRQQTGKAPLREDLARALVVASGWDPATPLCDPMMGAGTIVIEAATIARDIAPGLGRDFALARTALREASRLDELREAARHRVRDTAKAAIVGRDRARGAVTAATGNATRAGVLDDLELAEADLREAALPASPTPGAIVTNPPYGHRVRSGGPATAPYRALGDRVRALGPGWRVAIVSPRRALADATGLKLRRALTTDHGGIEVAFMTGET